MVESRAGEGEADDGCELRGKCGPASFNDRPVCFLASKREEG